MARIEVRNSRNRKLIYCGLPKLRDVIPEGKEVTLT
jgi:hypothetical protein